MFIVTGASGVIFSVAEHSDCLWWVLRPGSRVRLARQPDLPRSLWADTAVANKMNGNYGDMFSSGAAGGGRGQDNMSDHQNHQMMNALRALQQVSIIASWFTLLCACKLQLKLGQQVGTDD